MFAYCGNNPVNRADPTGHAFMFITAAIGAVVGAVAGGIIAAKSGKNVWAGIGIGAVAGGLIGLGVGAGLAMLSGAGISATTGEVFAGLTTVAATQADNISQAVQSGSQKMTDVAAKGKTGELLSGIQKNYEHIKSMTNTAQYRIPDGFDKGFKILSEVKNYSGTLSYTNQLKDFVCFTQANPGWQMHLYTNAILSGPLQQMVDSGIIKLFPLG